MATVKAFIRTTKKGGNVKVRFRISSGRGTQFFYTSDIEVKPEQWDNEKQTIKARALINESDRERTNTDVNNIKSVLLKAFTELSDNATAENFIVEVEKRLYPERYQPKEKTFYSVFDDFVNTKAKGQKGHLNVLKRSLQRFEMYRQITENSKYSIKLDTLSSADLQAFEVFLSNEHSFYTDYPIIYEKVRETRTPKPRGNNAVSNIQKRFRTFYLWANNNGHTANNPFRKYKVNECVYGTPYYITIEERNKIYHTDLTAHPQTAIQRDIFIFQCLVGCRVSDLYNFTKNNLKDGGNFIEYIPIKTKEETPRTVRVPLTDTAKEIINRHKDTPNGKLFPFISSQKYNVTIKKIFTFAEITRLVTVLNPTNGNEEQRPINEIASSHLARRAFIGNIYKQVKDPNLVGALSGHKEGSKAFARYRDIDDEIKTEIVKMLE